MKRIWATSDIHGNLSGIDAEVGGVKPSDCDCAIIAGDIAPLMNFQTWADQVTWFIKEFNPAVKKIFRETPVAIVPGNHDLWLKPEHLREWNPGVDLDDSAKLSFHFRKTYGLWLLVDGGVDLNDIRVYGSPWVPYINGGWAYEAPKDHGGEFLSERFSRIPEHVDVLVTHTPPLVRHETIDVSTFGGRTTRHFGSPELTSEIVRARPKLAVCGHIHSATKVPVILECGTVVRNVCRVSEEYRIAYEPAILEIP